MMCYSVMTQANSEKEIPSSPNRSRTYELLITSSFLCAWVLIFCLKSLDIVFLSFSISKII